MRDGIRRVSVERGGGWEYFNTENDYTEILPREYPRLSDDVRMLIIEGCRRSMKERIRQNEEQGRFSPVVPTPPRPRWEGKNPDIGSIARESKEMMFEGIENDDRRDFESVKTRTKSRLQIPDDLHTWLYYGVNHRDHYNGLGLQDLCPENLVDFSYANRIPAMMDLECVCDVRIKAIFYTVHMSGKVYDAPTASESSFSKRDRVFVQLEVELDDMRVIPMTLVMKSHRCDYKDIKSLSNMRGDLRLVRMEKYIHRCKKKVLPHYDPKKSYTKLTEEEMPQCLIQNNVFH